MVRKKLIIGYLLMVIGILLPLSLVTQMAVSHYQSVQEALRFEQKTPTWTSSKKQWVKDYQKIVEKENPATSDPFIGGGEMVKTPFEDDVIGYLKIPKIDLIQPIRLGASEGHLELGVAQVTGTDLPFGGKGKRSVLAGHRSWYTDLRYFRINELVAGDIIEIDLPMKKLVYEVQEQQVILADDWEQLLPQKDTDLVTLLTCEPIYPPFNYRLLVNAVRRSDTTSDNTSSNKKSSKKQQVVRANTHKAFGFNGLYLITAVGWLAVLFFSYRLWQQYQLKED